MTVQPFDDDTPGARPSDPVTPPAAGPEYVSLDELLHATAEPALVLEPPCRADHRSSTPRLPGWLHLVHQLVFTGWAPTWRAGFLVAVVTAAACAVLFLGSAIFKAVVVSAMSLVALRMGARFIRAARPAH
ncbi:hypothetical protein [Amycolatopsis magusensis]|uniref:hypothetical protein n=1 Tax=Amycolatopsis magusensis TaxID=882444 RepID=UPI003C304AFC